ncbi:NAD(+)/NADH kinase [Butyrivibrio proteoclasticus]|uniref:NAD(+)/NADH kinase n=1 Tax=Butyrivibrio proteoclasticus TaxID=43305 RepID=UPI00047EA5BA|nr:NAD(+)/NADH kinase [Butyrivibrio proteoclasticus]
MDHFCIVTNKSKDTDFKMTNYIRDYLVSHGKKCDIAESMRLEPSEDKLGRKYLSDIPEDAECVIVLGGDGTMLQAARSVASRDIPLIGVNLGTLGYLAEVETGGVDEALSRIISGNYETEERMMLYGLVNNKRDYALNDIVISRYSRAIETINFDIYVNDLFLCNYHADGIIISTPTGSTGYSMSAGGPIVEPSADMILITPICPHTLNSRSMVLSGNTKIRIVIGSGRDNAEQTVAACFDGSENVQMKTGDQIEIERSEKITKIIRLNRVSFLEVLGKKFDR